MSARRVGLITATTVYLAAALAAGIWWWSSTPDPLVTLHLSDVMALGLAAIFGERLLLPRARGRGNTMAVAVVGAVALLGLSPAIAAGLAAIAWTAQAVVARLRGGEWRVTGLLISMPMAWGMTGVVGLTAAADPLGITVGDSAVQLAPVLVWWGLLVLWSPAVEAAEMALRADVGRRLRYRDLLRTSWQPDTVLAATATLGALAYPALNEPTVLLMALPLLAAKVGLDRYSDIRRTYDQTLRAMSRLPEQLGAVDPGHGVRVGDLAQLAATELGFGAEVVADIERAAQLHELGRIRSERGIELEPEEVAVAGSSIVLEAGGLDRVADLIAAHRGPVPVGNDVAWVGGALIRLACDLDLRLQMRPDPALQAGDEAWLRAQGVQPRIANALVVAARRQYPAPTPA
jgi:hypothetical protein